ncbi:hypothetical protein KEM54_003012, partial [Ascosphaera aggregata]
VGQKLNTWFGTIYGLKFSFVLGQLDHVSGLQGLPYGEDMRRAASHRTSTTVAGRPIPVGYAHVEAPPKRT